MTASARCPNCGKRYNVAEQSVGSRAQCKSCGQTFTVAISVDDTSRPGDDSVSKTEATQEKRSSAPRKQTPKALGPYRLQRKLGAGAMGMVYLAHDPVLDRQVAIKILPPAFAKDEHRLKRFLREAKLAARLHHTNVAAVYQAGVDHGLVYMAMEFVDGTALDAEIAVHGAMPWRDATRAIRDAAAGLAAAHALGLVHRDIKPANLIRTKDGVTKIVDFGLARTEESQTQLTQQGALLGTPAYMAPEQWTGGEVDARTDLYSLACSYYYLLAGRLPFETSALSSLGYHHCHQPLPDPREHIPELPAAVCRVLARGAEKSPENRFQTAQELVDELDSLLGRSDVELAAEEPDIDASDDQPASSPLDDLFLEDLLPDQSTPSLPIRAAEPETDARLSMWIWIATGVVGALLFVAGFLVILMLTRPENRPATPEKVAAKTDQQPRSPASTKSAPKAAPASVSPAEPPQHPRTPTKKPATTNAPANASPAPAPAAAKPASPDHPQYVWLNESYKTQIKKVGPDTWIETNLSDGAVRWIMQEVSIEGGVVFLRDDKRKLLLRLSDSILQEKRGDRWVWGASGRWISKQRP